MPTLPPPRATLGALLRGERLDLRLDARVTVPLEALDAEVRWVHSSDLADPTPFLSDDVVLLTTGTQFADSSAGDIDAYVARLRSRGVLALGFGTEVVRDGVPAELARSCAEAGLPLFEVPYRTPFIAVARTNAEAIAAAANARQDWALTAQRALASAALRPNGLEGTIVELAQQLGAWVALYDTGGSIIVSHTARGAIAPDADTIEAEAAQLLRRGGTVGARIATGGESVTLQTIGTRGRSGVLAVSGPVLDREARGVVNSVIATTGLVLEQSTTARQADERVRSIVVRLLTNGEFAVASEVGEAAWGSFPSAPWIVLHSEAAGPEGSDAALERLAASAGAFFGTGGDGLTLIAPLQSSDSVRETFELLSWPAGTATSRHPEDFPLALAEAKAAHAQRADAVVTDIADVSRDLVEGLATPAAAVLAQRLLDPLARHDADHGTQLVPTLTAWLRSNGSNDTAATALGVHRHTVRARMTLVQQLLAVDLDSFVERANVWAALQLTAPGRARPVTRT